MRSLMVSPLFLWKLVSEHITPKSLHRLPYTYVFLGPYGMCKMIENMHIRGFRWQSQLTCWLLAHLGGLSAYQSIYISTLIYGHGLWQVTERIRSSIEATEISFLPRVSGLTLGDSVRSSTIWKEFGTEQLIHCAERSHLKWSKHLVEMPPGCLSLNLFRHARLVKDTFLSPLPLRVGPE